MSSLQLLTTKFENLWMNEDESICEFHIRLRDVSNTSFALGEQIFKEKMARKMDRSLSNRFDMKVTVIEQSHNLSNIKVDELNGCLKTFKMSINERSKNKNKGITFVLNTEDNQGDKEVNLSDDIALLSNKFNNSLKYLNRKRRKNVQDKRSDVSLQIKDNSEDKPNYGKGIQCSECEIFGHIKAEYPTFLKKNKKGLYIIWSDSDNENEEEIANNVMYYS